jgi:hypothetical protein
MASTYDLYHYFGSDLEVSPTGGLATATGSTLTDQTVIRYLLTNPGDDPFNPTFGLGASQMIGEPEAAAKVKALIIGGMKTLSVVDQTQPIIVNVYAEDTNTLTAVITYTDSVSGSALTQTVPIQ